MKQIWLCRTPDIKGSQISVTTSGFEISTFLHVERVTLKYCVILNSRVGIIRYHNEFFCLVNYLIISRLFIFPRRYPKSKESKKTITTKISNIKKRRYNLFTFFRKLRKIEFWQYLAYVIILTILFQSVMVTY